MAVNTAEGKWHEIWSKIQKNYYSKAQINGRFNERYCQACRTTSFPWTATSNTVYVGMTDMSVSSPHFSLITDETDIDNRGKVVCNRDGRVRVSGQVDIYSSGASGPQCVLFLYRNGASTGYYTRTTMTNDYTTLIFAPIIINVNSGDMLYFRIDPPNDRAGYIIGNYNATRINIEYI